MAGFFDPDGVDELEKTFAGLLAAQSGKLALGDLRHFGDVGEAVIIIIVGADVIQDGFDPRGAGMIGVVAS